MTATIAYLVADLDVGGIQSMVDLLARGLDRARFAPAFVCFDRVGAIGEKLRADGHRVALVQRRPGIDLTLPARLSTAFAAVGAAVVHAHNRTALFYGVLARGLRTGPPRLVYTEHDRSFPELLRVRLLHRVLSRRIDAVAAVCAAVRDAIVATEGFPAARTEVVVNGVPDPPPVPDRASARRALRAEFGIEPGRAVVLAVGHLTAVKDHATLLRALAAIEPSRRPALVVAGDGDLRPSLEALRGELGLQADVHLPGYRRNVDALLRGCDLLAMSSISEGLSIALVEAIARGVPVVATKVGGNGDVVADGVNGLLVPPRDPRALAAAIARLAGDVALRERFGAAGRERFRTAFRLETMVAAYERVYERAMRATVN